MHSHSKKKKKIESDAFIHVFSFKQEK